MSHHYRCNKCSTRNVLPRALHLYRRIPKCRNCLHDRFRVDKERANRVSCWCEGAYHWGAHRAGSPMCIHNPNVWINRAKRAGATDDDLIEIRIDLALEGIGGKVVPHGVVPF